MSPYDPTKRIYLTNHSDASLPFQQCVPVCLTAVGQVWWILGTSMRRNLLNLPQKWGKKKTLLWTIEDYFQIIAVWSGGDPCHDQSLPWICPWSTKHWISGSWLLSLQCRASLYGNAKISSLFLHILILICSGWKEYLEQSGWGPCSEKL